MIAEENVAVTVGYGLGANCAGTFTRKSVSGKTARAMIQRVVQEPQLDRRSARTASVLRNVLSGGRILDCELILGQEDVTAVGTPIELDQVVLPEEKKDSLAPEKREITLRVSEPYQGGA
jgi:hypothetical protein